MRLTPIDIQNQKFSHAFRGYSEEEVDEFLDRVLKDYEALHQENLTLQEKIELVTHEIERYHQLEESIQKALVTSQNAAEDFLRAKKEEAELALERARMEADKLMETTRTQVEAIQKEYAELRHQKEHFYLEFKTLLQTHLNCMPESKEDKGLSLQSESGQ
jgi:cell division initiation protein